jgi:hypothetical protein
MAWRRPRDPFPAPLQTFIESEWEPVPGECLGRYACHGAGYTAGCVPRDGEFCGQLHYEMLARDYPDLLPRARRIDAFTRWKAARCGWLGEGNPGWAEEMFLGAPWEHEILHGKPPAPR